MTTNDAGIRFLNRFESIRHRMRRTGLITALLNGATLVVAGIAILAGVDFIFEEHAESRRVRLAVLACGALLVVIRNAWRITRRWSRPETAAELEERFPELGQRVRTTVQFAGLGERAIRRAGTEPSLVDALSVETADKTEPLSLDIVVPKHRLWLSAAACAAAVLGMLVGVATSWEWRVAVQRTLLSEVPYTTISVEPGDTTVDDGGDVAVAMTLRGRTNREVTVWSRPVSGGEDWQAEVIEPAEEATASEELRLTSELSQLTEPTEYRITAGPVGSDTYHIAVRYPLAITDVSAEVTPPAYTRLPSKEVPEGNLTALKGSHAEFRVTLDRVPTTAEFLVTPVGRGPNDADGPRTVPAEVDGAVVRMALDLDADFEWQLLAESSDGTGLPDNSYRVRVREDQAPRVSFREPREELEVHTLAEVMMQIRATDDYGLSRSGIVFQVNNDEEHVLLEEDFQAALDALDEASLGGMTPQTRSTAEEILPLEYFGLTQKDCVAYYAFVEDNFPDGPQRSETDLYFIDIRPFKTIYRLDDSEPGMGDDNNLLGLEEVIRRQRYALNRTIRLAHNPNRWGDGELNTVERLLEYETEIAEATRDLAEFFEGEGTDGADVLFQAEVAMLSAVDSLGIAEFETASLQERDAQRLLVEARNRLEIALAMNPQAARAARQFNRQLQQKLRRPDNDELERRIVEELQQLAASEASVAMALAMQGSGGGGQTNENEQTDSEMTDSDSNATNTSESSESDPSESATGQTPATEPGAPDSSEPGDESGEPTDATQEGSPESPGEETGDNAAESEQPGMLSPQEIEDRQADIVTRAMDLQSVMNGIDEITELAKVRMARAIELADAASGALTRGNSAEATDPAGDAADAFRELSRQVAVLLANEPARQVSMSRDLAADIAFRGQQLADELDRQSGTGMGESDSEDGQSEGMSAARNGRRLQAAGETLEDVLKAVATREESESPETQDRVAELLESEELSQALAGLEGLESEESNEKRAAAARDISEQMELTAVELDRLYRSIVSPRIEELRELERRAVTLQEQLETVETDSQIGGWRRDAEEFLEETDGAGIADAVDELQAALEDGVGPRWDWMIGPDGYYVAPEPYHTSLRFVVESLQRHMQELILADLLSSRDAAVPPEFEDFVSRYLQVLAADPGAEQP